MAALFIVFVVGVVLGCSFSAVLKWNEIRYRKKGVPPGTMGLPFVGETPEFLKQGPNFMKNKRAKYGSLFKTHILGCPTVVSNDPEIIRYILLSEGKGLVPGYPQSMLDILGKYNVVSVNGQAHKTMRGSLLSITSPSIIKNQLLPKIDQFMRSHLINWDGKTIDIQQRSKEMVMLNAFCQVGIKADKFEELKKEFFGLVSGVLTLPINLPGTSYRRGLQARENIVRVLREIIEERRASPNVKYHDMLGGLMGTDSKYDLNVEEVMDQVIMIIYSGYETVSTTSMMTVKYLHDNPTALQELREEHLEIRKRKGPNDPIDWNDYQSMKFTRSVILETMRLATIVNGVLRKTMEDVEFNGFIIPKGWGIYLYTRDINYDPFLYPEPLTFNPWRWEDKSLESHKYYLLFGGGSRLCPGKELGIVEVSIFLHHFITRYRWEEVGGDKLLTFPRCEAPNGLHIKVSKY